MATPKGGRKKGARRSAGKARADRPREKALRRYEETFPEWRFEPTATGTQYLGVLGMSLGAVALGAGVYGSLLSDSTAGPVTYAPYALAVGVVLLVGAFLFGSSSAPILRVGLFGVGTEGEGKVLRTRWYELESVSLTHDVLRLISSGRPLSVSLKQNAAAARRVLGEALRRIPDRVELSEAEQARIGAPRSSDGARVDAEPPQVTGLLCQASDRELTFEKDVRLCGRCGAAYHRAGVPSRCVACSRRLKRA